MVFDVIHTNKSIEKHVTLNDKQASELSLLMDVAAVASVATTPKGFRTLYVNGVRMQYNPVTNDIIGHHDRLRGRISRIS